MSTDELISATESTSEPRGRAESWIAAVAPGAAVSGLVAVGAILVGRAVPIVGAPVVAIVAGIVISPWLRFGDLLRPGLSFVSRRVLQSSIVLLGFGLSARQVLAVGESSLPVLLGTLVVALGVAWLAGRLLGTSRNVTTLVGVGTAICGASAIAATDAVISADQAEVSYAIATIFTFNVVAVLTFPVIGHVFGMSQHAFGLWAGTAINDASSVVAASTVYGHSATAYAVIVKLTRTTAIVPITLALARGRATRLNTEPREGSAGVMRPSELWRAFPLFILGFLLAVAVESTGRLPVDWHPWLGTVAGWMITAALAAIGLSTDFRKIRRAGGRPLALGAILWVTVSVTSLLIQALVGAL